MDGQTFVEAIRLVVFETPVKGTVDFLRKPPGRSPGERSLRLSGWFNALSEDDRSRVVEVIRMATSGAVFDFLCVLDGVSQITNPDERGELKLYHVRGGESVLLNDPNEEPLHDTFRGGFGDDPW